MEISVVIPVYNEEGNLASLFKRLCKSMDEIGRPWEAIFVNDGSRDASGELLRQYQKERPDVVRIIDFNGNFGQHTAIIAMPSITTKGVSKIAPVLDTGAGVVTTRNHIHWLVTENGAVDLYGKTLQERARLVISIAHPSAQEELDRAAFERFGSHHHYIKGYMQK